MSDTIAVRCRGVVKRFYRYEHRTTSLREIFVRSLLRRPLHVRHPEFELDGLDLEVSTGEAVSLIGPNGSGKSTALRLMAGVYAPTEGVVETWGTVSAVIELGVGFHPELTGVENVDLYGSVLGMSRRAIQERRKRILEFADIGQFVDMPVKHYSSGMKQRLAFAVAVSVDPDLLFLDEALAVGDAQFRRKCLSYLKSYHARGGTLVVVTHDTDVARELCGRAVWLERGRIRMDGALADVVSAYQETVR